MATESFKDWKKRSDELMNKSFKVERIRRLKNQLKELDDKIATEKRKLVDKPAFDVSGFLTNLTEEIKTSKAKITEEEKEKVLIAVKERVDEIRDNIDKKLEDIVNDLKDEIYKKTDNTIATLRAEISFLKEYEPDEEPLRKDVFWEALDRATLDLFEAYSSLPKNPTEADIKRVGLEEKREKLHNLQKIIDKATEKRKTREAQKEALKKKLDVFLLEKKELDLEERQFDLDTRKENLKEKRDRVLKQERAKLESKIEETKREILKKLE